MYLKNTEELVNGSRGIVIGFTEDLPIVKFITGTCKVIDYYEWDITETDDSTKVKIKKTITQIIKFSVKLKNMLLIILYLSIKII